MKQFSQVICGSGVVSLPLTTLLIVLLLLIIHTKSLSFCLLYPLSYPSSPLPPDEPTPTYPSSVPGPVAAELPLLPTLMFPVTLPLLRTLLLLQFNLVILTILLSLSFFDL